MLRRTVIGVLLAISSSAAVAADPLTLILLRILRDQIITAAAEAAYDRLQAPKPPAGPIVFPAHPYDLDDARLRTLIEEGFVHLTSAQRDEVYASVKRILADPKNASIRFHIIEDLALKASAVRQAHEQLNNLSDVRKRAIASEAREEYRRLKPEERQQMLAVLRSGVMPIPRDLNDMMLAEFQSVPAPPETVTPAASSGTSPVASPPAAPEPVVQR
jgi:DNA-binding PucR family transcriptional regulator